MLLLLACAVLASAADDARSQAKAVWQAAASAGEVWTCLQLEAWARMQQPALRLGSLLGDSTVLGDPLFAFPDVVDGVYDCGERIVVYAGRRAYVLAPDGRPLQPAVPVPGSWRTACGYGGGAVMGVVRDRGGERVVATRLADGRIGASARLNLGPTQSLTYSRVVADDGSAAAVEVTTQDATSGQVSVHAMVCAGDRPPRALAAGHGLIGIGRNAAWLLTGAPPRIRLHRGEQVREAVAAAGGPGLAAIVADGRALLIRLDGSEVPLAGTPSIGKAPALATVGSWLVLASGSGAEVVSSGDLLGDGAGVKQVQPPTLALWRWADLVADPAAKPVAIFPGELSPATGQRAALWAWEGKRLDLIDLSGDQPRREPWLEAARAITWAVSDLHAVRLYHAEGVKSVHGPDRRELWAGACAQVQVKRPDLALVLRRQGERQSWSLVCLSPDPQQRRETALQIPDQDQVVRVSWGPPDVIIARAERNWWRSVGLDGKVLETAREAGPEARSPPACPEWSWFMPDGRFQRRGARVLPKDWAAPTGDPLAAMRIADAWRVGGTTMLLDASGGIIMSGRKRGAWIELPAVAAADRFALAGQTTVLAVGDDLRLVAALAPGPKLERREGTVASELPAGPWRIERQWCFTPPRSRQLIWDEERVGWRPLRLRSPEGSGLFVVTPSLLIELEPAAAKFFGG